LLIGAYLKNRPNLLETALNLFFAFACVSSAILGMIYSPSSAATCQQNLQAESGNKTVSIAELYTSEGCDSCPPTDKWFSTISLKKTGVVPLAFHVDYWDYIGWKDRFGKPGFADRQRTLVGLQGSRTVYTPQVMFNGKDARGNTSDARFDSSVRDLAAKKPAANISLRGQLAADSIDVTVGVNLADESSRKDAALYIALSENNLISRVTAGENKGVSLKHDHVVRELSGPFQLSPAVNGSTAEIKRAMSIPKEWKREDMNLVAFVQNTRSGEILQAISIPACAP
jgi:hypothetical protein